MKHFIIGILFVAALAGTGSSGCSSSSLLSTGSSLMSSLGANPNLSTLTELLKTPGLDKILGGVTKSPFTLLAPTNDAFKSLGNDAINNLTKPENANELAGILKNQIVPGKLDSTALAKGGVTNAAGKAVDLSGINLGSLTGTDKFNIIPVDKLLK